MASQVPARRTRASARTAARNNENDPSLASGPFPSASIGPAEALGSDTTAKMPPKAATTAAPTRGRVSSIPVRSVSGGVGASHEKGNVLGPKASNLPTASSSTVAGRLTRHSTLPTSVTSSSVGDASNKASQAGAGVAKRELGRRGVLGEVTNAAAKRTLSSAATTTQSKGTVGEKAAKSSLSAIDDLVKPQQPRRMTRQTASGSSTTSTAVAGPSRPSTLSRASSPNAAVTRARPPITRHATAQASSTTTRPVSRPTGVKRTLSTAEKETKVVLEQRGSRLVAPPNRVTTRREEEAEDKAGIAEPFSKRPRTSSPHLGLGDIQENGEHPPTEQEDDEEDFRPAVDQIDGKMAQAIAPKTAVDEEDFVIEEDPEAAALAQDDLASRAHSAREIVDVDAIDANDPAQVTEYVHDIFLYMKKLEQLTMPNPTYMDEQPECDWNMRGILIDWIIEVHHKFRLLPETLFLAVNLVDRFLSARVVSVTKLQLVGTACLFIAAKYEEVICPSAANFLHMTDGGYDDEEILRAERYVLTTLGFDLSYPNPIHFLRRVSKAETYDIQTRTIGKYLMEIACVDHNMLSIPPSLLGAAGIWLARFILDRDEWDATMTYYSSYSEEEILPAAQLMLNYVFSTADPPHDLFFKKYAAKKYMKASTFVREWAARKWPPVMKGQKSPGNELREYVEQRGPLLMDS